MKKILVLPLLLIFFGCDSDSSFYNSTSDQDLCVLPLIKPYRLINAGAEDNEQTHAWGLRLKRYYNAIGSFNDNGLNVGVINIEDSVIYGHGKDGKTAFPNFWFIIDVKSDREMVFKDEVSWRSKLSELKCKHDTLYDIWTIYEAFKKDGHLPWPTPWRANGNLSK